MINYKLKIENRMVIRMAGISVLLLTVMTITSCSKYLDTQPTSFIPVNNYFQTADQMNSALTGVYELLGSGNLYGENLWAFLNSSTDESFYTRSGSTTLTGPVLYNYTPADGMIGGLWSDLYTGINRANLLLDNINKPLMDSASRSVVQGEALFLRAYYYFLLVSNWGDVPMPLHATTSPDSIYFPKTKSRAVYTQIINDMTLADSLVKTITQWGYSGRVSKTVVEGILARVCLFRAGYPFTDSSAYFYSQSLNWSNKVVNSGIHSLNPSYSQIFINHCQNIYDIKESMWEVEFTGNGIGTNTQAYGWVGCANGIACDDNSIGYSYGFLNTTVTLFNAYTGSNKLVSPDKRRDWNIAPFAYKTYKNNITGLIDSTTTTAWPIYDVYNRNCGKWRRSYEVAAPKSKNFTAINFPLLRFADVLLMNAEAINEVNQGPTPAAYDAINQVRRRAFGFPVNVINKTSDLPVGLGYTAFQQAVYNERLLELCFEGLRRNDLIRWGTFLPTMQAVAYQILSSAPSSFLYAANAASNVQPKHQLFPIPSYEMALNPAMNGQQNPGW